MVEELPDVVDVLVIGAGQSGLASAHRLLQRGFAPAIDPVADPAVAPADRPAADQATRQGGADLRGRAPSSGRTFLVLDAEDGPGGAWRHRWPTLTMATVNGIHDLPGAALPDPDPAEPARQTLPRYFGEYERSFGLPVLRPVRVLSVQRHDDDPHGLLDVATTRGTLQARAVMSATGTWSRPFWPVVPGKESFAGVQLHTHDYPGPGPFRGRRVAVVGGGISGVGHVREIAEVAEVFWYTRTPPRWTDEPFDVRAGLGVERRVEERVEAGLRPLPVVAETGLYRSPALQRDIDSGVLARRPMFTEILPYGVREQSGEVTEVDVILWATGFRHELRHLTPLGVRTRQGGVYVRGTSVVGEPRLHLVGYGPAASTIGATRAARRAVAQIVGYLDGAGR